MLDVRIDPAAARESDLLAFEIGIERGHPGAVMCAYNQVNGVYSCENDWLLNQVLKGDWRYPGFVMSDWGAVHSTVRSALAGLDQESGEQLDTRNFFGRLGLAVEAGEVPQTRLDDMTRRILTSIFACGLADDAHAAHASHSADLREGDARRARDRAGRRGAAAQPGHFAAGGGCAPHPCRRRARRPRRARRRRFFAGRPSRGDRVEGSRGKRPCDVLRSLFAARGDPTGSSLAPMSITLTVEIPREAARAGARADAVVVFADQYLTETADAPNLKLARSAGRADRERRASQSAHRWWCSRPAGRVLMPWLDRTAAVIEAWYPGQKGGEAIADILSGAVDPSGRLPVTFPASEAQLPHRKIQGDPNGAPIGPLGRGRRYGRIFGADYAKARRSATNGSRSAAKGRCFRSAMDCPTPPSISATSR